MDFDITLLSDLLQKHASNGECRDGIEIDGAMKKSSNDVIIPAKRASSLTREASKSSRPIDFTSIWTEDEILAADNIDESKVKEEPKHQLYFKTVVGAEDAFLGKSDKTELSSECSHIVIKVHLPGCERHDISLDVTPNQLNLETGDKKLFLCMPQQVDSGNGKAEWDKQKKMLTVSLPIARMECW